MKGQLTILAIQTEECLNRPASANIDQALVIFAIVKPDPNYNLCLTFLNLDAEAGDTYGDLL